MQPTTIGLDLAKHVFQVHGIADGGKVVVRKKLRRKRLPIDVVDSYAAAARAVSR